MANRTRMTIDPSTLWSDDTEAAVIAGVIGTKSDELRERVMSAVQLDDFISPLNKRIFEICKRLYEQGHGLDYVTVNSQLNDGDKLLKIMSKGTVNTVSHLNLLKSLAIRRRIAATCIDLAESAATTKEDVYKLIDKVSSDIFKATEVKSDKGLVRVGDMASTMIAELERRASSPHAQIGIRSGYRTHEDMMGGFHTQKLDVIAARPAMGKTALMLNFVARSCCKHKTPTLIYSLEMSRDELMWRMVPIIARVDNEVIKSGKLDTKQQADVQYAVNLLTAAPLFIDDTAQRFASMCVAIRNAVRRHGIKQVWIDYLQLIHPSNRGGKEQTRDRELTEMSQGLKELAKECDINIVMLSQLNRSLESREDKRPMMSDLRESGGIEQAADNVIMLYREAVYEEECDQNAAELIVRKQRNGTLGTIPMLWHGHQFRFEDISTRIMGEAPLFE